jgi:predicted nucleic acid-binding protein
MIERKILIDANLLLLFVVGFADIKLIKKQQKRLSKYEIEHFEILNLFIEEYSKIVVTPHILAEFWNLMGEERGNWDRDKKRVFDIACSIIKNAVEIYNPAAELIERKEIKWLGISDVSLLIVAENEGYPLISADAKLCIQAMNLGIETYNIWHIWDNQ